MAACGRLVRCPYIATLAGVRRAVLKVGDEGLAPTIST